MSVMLHSIPKILNLNEESLYCETCYFLSQNMFMPNLYQK